jgi:hypothetical protein
MYDHDDEVAQMSQTGRYYVGEYLVMHQHFVLFQILQLILTKDLFLDLRHQSMFVGDWQIVQQQ